jgi:hypothetical protein
MTISWGVVQLVGHLTVNEDGVGSSPTAPANFLPFFVPATLAPRLLWSAAACRRSFTPMLASARRLRRCFFLGLRANP